MAQNLIKKGWSVSCSYDYTESAEGGTENNIPYDIEFLDGEFTHLAIVNDPRYERANIVFNCKTVINDADFETKHPRDEQGRFTDIPTDNNGYSLKLIKSQRESINMGKAMAKGFYPEEQVRITLSGATKAGKKLKKLFDENKKYKTNFRINYAYKDNNFNDWVWDDEVGDLAPSAKPVYFDTEEEANEWIKKQGENIVNPKVKQVEEWHHISGGGRNKLIDINDLVKLGFNVDTSTANKEFKLKIVNSNPDQPRVPKGSPEGGQFAPKNKYISGTKSPIENFYDIHRNYAELAPEEYKGKPTFNAVLAHLGSTDNNSAKIKTPLSEIIFNRNNLHHLIIDHPERLPDLNKMIKTLQAPNLIVSGSRDGKNYNYYIKNFKEKNENKGQFEVVKIAPDGDFYSTSYTLNGNKFKQIINEGQIIFDLTSDSTAIQKNVSVNNIIPPSDTNLNPNVKNNKQTFEEAFKSFQNEQKKEMKKGNKADNSIISEIVNNAIVKAITDKILNK